MTILIALFAGAWTCAAIGFFTACLMTTGSDVDDSHVDVMWDEIADLRDQVATLTKERKSLFDAAVEWRRCSLAWHRRAIEGEQVLARYLDAHPVRRGGRHVILSPPSTPSVPQAPCDPIA